MFGVSTPAVAQKVITGVVIDAQTGETLPAVTLFDFARAEGTITNAAGRFELRLAVVPATLDIRHIGYESRTLEITNDSPANIEVLLTPVRYTLEEVFVSGEDPAYNIMRKVIEKKQSWQANLATFTAESYSRYMLYSEFDLAQVQESIAMWHWKRGGGTRSYVRARRMRPVFTDPMRFASTQNIPNFYDDTIEVPGFKLIGPTHPRAPELYTFTLAGYHEQDGQRVYDIYFSPKSALSTAFMGHVSVLDSAYVLLKAQMRPSPNNVLPAPIKDWDAFYEQQFAPYGDSLWLPVDLQIEGNVSFGRLGVEYPTARYRQVSRVTKYVFNLPVPDTLFESDQTIVSAPNVDRQDHLFRWNPGLIPMTPQELEEVVAMDPRKGLGRSFRAIGLLANYTAINLSEEAEATDVPVTKGPVDRVLSNLQLGYNRIEGFFLGVRQDLSLSSALSTQLGFGYGVSSKLPAYDFALKFKLGHAFVRGGIAQLRDTQYASRGYSGFVAGVTTYVGWEDYFDFYKRNARFVELGLAFDEIRTIASVKLSRESHKNVDVFRDRKGWFFGSTRRDNPIIDEGDVSLLTGELQIGDVPNANLKPVGHGIKLTVAHNPGLNTDFASFTRFEGFAALTIPTLYQRRKWPNELRLRLYGATYAGSLPPQFMSILETSRRPITAFGAFKSLHGLPIKGANVWSLAWEHDFSTSFFEWLGLWGVAQNGIGFTVHGAHGQALGGSRSADLFSRYDDAVQHELGISLTNFFNMPIRIDLTRNLDHKALSIGLGIVKKF